MACGLWRLARLAAAHFCARGICISIFQHLMVSERSDLAAGGGLDDVPAAYLILWRGARRDREASAVESSRVE